MFTEDDLLPLSGLQHLLFCERQCALMHVEGLWRENRLTVEGRHLHERVHSREDETRSGVRIVRSLALRSLRLGLRGVADVVEFHPDPAGAPLPCAPGRWRPFPVEYKRGREKRHDADRVQLCAQALCLEEMLHTSVPAGALFYGRPRRRATVTFGPALRETTTRAAMRLHDLVNSGITPPPRAAPKCRNCSLREYCLPRAGARRTASGYLRSALLEATRNVPGDHE